MQRSLFALSLLAASSSAMGQAVDWPVDRRVELEEFAVPNEASNARAIGQISDTQADRVGSGPGASDRDVILPQDRTGQDVAVTQVPRQAGDVVPPQVSRNGAEARRVDPAALSSPEQSAPGGVTRLSGRDRCDPQADQSLYRACVRVIERRSAEFGAPSAPVLSAEEALLAQRRADDEDPATLTLEQRIRRASQSVPDAELSTNQELASLVLPGTAGVPTDPVQGDTTLGTEEVDAVLRAIGINVSPQP